MKPIEEIRKGDWVWSVAPETGDPELKQVEDVFVNETDEIVHVRYGDTEIDATPNHPFYVAEKGWVSAVNLRAGDRLQLLNGEYVVVEQVQHEILESPIKVYNFEVQDNHTYYVGGDDDDSAVLVHNKCGDAFAKLSKAKEYGIKSYKDLLKLAKGKGLQVHHIIEQRFAKHWGKNLREMLSVVLTKEEHKKFTKAWRDAIGYGAGYVSVDKVWEHAQIIYKDYPELLEAARKTLNK